MTKVLIVDDQEDARIAIRDALKLISEKYSFLEAGNEYECFKELEKETPDIILLDVMIPGGNGINIASKIRRIESLRDVPILFLTGLNKDDIEESLSYGISSITKPFEIKELHEKIQSILKKGKN